MMMMKKLIILLAILACGIGQVRADWYVTGNSSVLNSSTSWGTQTENKMHVTSDPDIYVLVVENKNITAWTSETKNEFEIKVTDGTNYYPAGGEGTGLKVNFQSNGTYTIIYYYRVSDHSIRFVATPMLRWDLGNSGNGNWSWTYDTNSHFTRVDDFSWTYTISSANFTKDTAFRIYSALWDKSAYPNGKEVSLTYGGDQISSAYFNYTASTEWSWKISKPSYEFNEVIISTTYKPFDTTNGADFGQWDTKVDAYVTHSLTYDYATYSVAAPLDFSKATGVKGFYASSFDASKVTFTKIDGTCAANTGLLLAKDGTDPVSIPVASSGTDYSISNKLKHGTGAGVNSDGSYNRYVLARNTTSGDIHFAKLTSSKEVSVGKAYLEVAASSAPSLSIAFDGEDDMTTGINASLNDKAEMINDNAIYNLAGQRVTNPTKGLYIVNGRKVVVK